MNQFWKSIVVFLLSTQFSFGQSTSFNGSYGSFLEKNVGTTSTFSSGNTSLSENQGLFSSLINPSSFKKNDNDIEVEFSYFLLNPQNQTVLVPSIRKNFKKSSFTFSYANTSNNNIIDSRNFYRNSTNFQNQTFGSLKYNSQFFVGSYTQQINNWNIGGNIKFFHENIGNILIKNGFSSDIGLNKSFNNTKVGVLAKNFIGSHENWRVNLSQLSESIGLFNQNNGETIGLRESGYDVYNPTLVFGINQKMIPNDSIFQVNILVDLVNYLGSNPNDIISSRLLSTNFRLAVECLIYQHLLLKFSSLGLDKDLFTNDHSLSYGFGIGYTNTKIKLEFGGFRRKWLSENFWSFGGTVCIALNNNHE